MTKILTRIRKLLSRHGIGPGKKKHINEIDLNIINLEKLHIGCGNIHMDGWCNIDVLKTGATDLICDIKSLKGVPDNTAKNIYSCHVLEHFETSQIPEILETWNRVLKPGGEIRISVPDLDSITKIYQDNLKHFETPGNQPWIALIYGGQKDQYDFHKTGFNYSWLKFLLENAGFNNVKRYHADDYFMKDIEDNSKANAPFGVDISVNVVAYKKNA